MSSEAQIVHGREAMDELIAQERRRLEAEGLGHFVLLAPARPGDGRNLTPGMGKYLTKTYPRPGREVTQTTYPDSRVALTTVLRDAACITSFATMHDVRGLGSQVEPDENGHPVAHLLAYDRSLLDGEEVRLHLVSSGGWLPDKTTMEPNAKGHKPKEPFRYAHGDPANVVILGTATLTGADIWSPVAVNRDPGPEQAYYEGVAGPTVIHKVWRP